MSPALLPRRPRLRAIILAAPLLASALSPALTRAQTPPAVAPSASASAPSGAALPAAPSPEAEQAKRYFEQGESLRAAGQFQAALEAYLKSRALVPRASNTLNAAVCLYNLGRYDESYDLFEESLTKFAETALPKESRESAKSTMASIETKVGRLDVSANVDGTLLVDGRVRGKLPLGASIRVLPGKRLVRVLRDGFETFERAVDVKAGTTTSLDAKLNPLTTAGRLRVEADASLDGATLVVDGATVGTLPWEGTLAPGTHVIAATKGDAGTGPKLANVIVGQTVKVSVSGGPLGPERRILIEPPTAELSVDGVALGKGRFQTRLTVGTHVIEAREEGYKRGRVSAEVDGESAADIVVRLEIDSTHPRWNVAKPLGRFGLELFGGYGFSSSFGNEADGCAAALSCTQQNPAGLRAGVTGIFEFASGLGIYAQVGYRNLRRTQERQYKQDILVTTTSATPFHVYPAWDLFDDLHIDAPFASIGVGYRLKMGSVFDLSGRVFVAAGFASTSDTVTGTVSDATRNLNATAEGSQNTFHGLLLDVVPELALGLNFGSVRVSLGAALPVSLVDGPTVALGSTIINDPRRDQVKHPQSIDILAGQAFASNVKAYGRFVEIVPQATVGYWF